ncbi:MAG: hypothetical protein ACTSUE_25390 [Promethearchaeota archaeon]
MDAEKEIFQVDRDIEVLERESVEGMDDIIKSGGKWEDIGFHRPLGNFFYGVSIGIFNTIIGLALISLVTGLLYPFPEIQGYNNIAGALYAIVYQAFDTGTAFGIERFIAEWRVKDPSRMLKYVQFYIWYQMMTGIIQVVIISSLVLYVVRLQSLAYLSWILLIICQKQWPGMLNIFRSVLNGLQLYNKTQVLGLISGQVFQNLTNVIFILLGRWVGLKNHAVGEIVGMAIGAAIGAYVDDFFAMWASAYYFNKAMKPFGFTARDCFRVEFDRIIVKQCLWFGFQVSVVPLISTAISTGVLFMMIDSIPAFATYKALVGWIGGLVGFIDQGNFALVPSIAESYMNGKKSLARFYIANSLRWNGFLGIMFSMVLVSAMPMVLDVILDLPGLQYYSLAFVFFVPALLHRMLIPFIQYPDFILVGVLKINFYTFSRVLEEFIYIFENWLFMYVFKIQVVFGLNGIVWLLAMERFIGRVIKMIMMWVYIHRKVFKVKFYFYQMIICPLIAGLPIIAFGLLWKPLVFDPLIPVFSFLGDYDVLGPALITILVAILVVPTCIYLPLTGYLGGWDTFGLMTLKKAINLSGPSKPFAKLIYKSVMTGVRRSKLHNRFKIPWEQPMKEIHELMELKRDQQAKLYEDKKPIGFGGVVQ